MARFKLSGALTTRLMLLIPSYEKAYGVSTSTYPDIADGIEINACFRTFGGTDMDVNGQIVVQKTATIETWFRPDIQSDCRFGIPETGEVYEILGDPEDIEMRHQYMRIRLTQLKGRA